MIMMSVDDYVVVWLPRHEAVPGGYLLKCIGDNHCGAWVVLPHSVVPVVVELANFVHIKIRAKGCVVSVNNKSPASKAQTVVTYVR